MDALIRAAARALASGDPLRALQCVALREDADGLALRGIAMAQLGELARARDLLRRAARRFGANERARARCVVAEAEVTLALRESVPTQRLDAATSVLELHGDRQNVAHARLLAARHALLLGRVDEAEQACADVELGGAPPMLRSIGALVQADIEIRRGRATQARSALQRARKAASVAGIDALAAEVDRALARLDAPAARIVRHGGETVARLDEVQAVLGGHALVVDACRRVVGPCSLARRPVLFGLARRLAEAWPHDVSRQQLLERVFGQRRASESLRARLRVEIGRLRAALRGVAEIEATGQGFRFAPLHGDVVLLLPPVEGDDAAVLALVSDGAAWSTSVLALALGVSQRTVQRALRELEAQGRVRAIGRARARRWSLAAVSGHATAFSLPATPAVHYDPSDADGTEA